MVANFAHWHLENAIQIFQTNDLLCEAELRTAVSKMKCFEEKKPEKDGNEDNHVMDIWLSKGV